MYAAYDSRAWLLLWHFGVVMISKSSKHELKIGSDERLYERIWDEEII